MDWLTSLPAGLLVAGWLALALLIAFGARLFVRSRMPVGDDLDVLSVAAPMMPALGAVFGVFIALTLAGEVGYLKSAQDVVADEAAAASRLAWAATSPRVRSESIHAALREYLETTRASEWRDGAAEEGHPRVADALAVLEQTVRAEAAHTYVGTPAGTELLTSLNAITSSRRERIAAASREIPMLYVVTLIIAGAALTANAGAVGFKRSVVSALLVAGLAIVVGLSLALLFSIAAPWRGPLIVDGHPIDSVIRDIQGGFFG